MTNTPPPTGTPPRSAKLSIFGCLALVVLFAVVAALGVSGSFWAMIASGSLLVIGGIIIAVVLYRRGRVR